MEKIKRYSTEIGIILFLYIPLILFYLYTHRPNSATGWAILIIIGIPLSLGLEVLFEVALSEKAGKSISYKKFSGFRIFLALLFAVLILGTLGILFWYIRPYVEKYFT